MRRWWVSRPWRLPAVAVGVAVLVTLVTVLLTPVYGPDDSLYAVDSPVLAGVAVVLALSALRPGVPPHPVERWLVWSAPAVVVALQLARFGVRLPEWDVLWVSIWLVIPLSWQAARDTPHRMSLAVRRLTDSGMLAGDPARIGELRAALDRLGRRFAWAGGVVAAAVFSLTTADSLGLPVGWNIWPRPFTVHFPPMLLTAFALGAWAGLMAAYGRFGATVRRHGLRLRVVANHPDGACGLLPVGQLYLYQSLVAAVPGLFIGAWLMLFARGDQPGIPDRYDPFALAYAWLLLVPVAVAVLAFVWPMLSIHAAMKARKENRFWPECDRLSRQIVQLRGRLGTGRAPDPEVLQSRLDALERRYTALRAAPTWPVDRSIKRRFTLQNLALLLPFLGYVVGGGAFWQHLSDLFTGFR